MDIHIAVSFCLKNRPNSLNHMVSVRLLCRHCGFNILLLENLSSFFTILMTSLRLVSPTFTTTIFIAGLKQRFSVSHKARADFYLQARIRSDVNGNIYLDQQRYAMAIINRNLTTFDPSPSKKDKQKYWHPETSTNKWTKLDNLNNINNVKQLEQKYNLQYKEAVGSLNYLCNTFPRGLYTIRKLCKFMNLPGSSHFCLLVHFLCNLRCHPLSALVFYHNVSH
jgi:hypothetical protein